MQRRSDTNTLPAKTTLTGIFPCQAKKRKAGTVKENSMVVSSRQTSETKHNETSLVRIRPV